MLAWQRTIWMKGAFSLAAERPEYDTMINSLLVEFDAEQRVTLQHEMDQTLYEQYHRVMLGTQSTTWALNKQVGAWAILLSVPIENNYEYVTPV